MFCTQEEAKWAEKMMTCWLRSTNRFWDSFECEHHGVEVEVYSRGQTMHFCTAEQKHLLYDQGDGAGQASDGCELEQQLLQGIQVHQAQCFSATCQVTAALCAES